MKRIVQWATKGNLSEIIGINHIHHSKLAVRSNFGDLTSLMASISRRGLAQPILVRPAGVGFEIVCGHRRYEACKRLKFKEIPCIIDHFTDRKAFELSIIENLQRQDLDPIDEARAYKRYVDELGWGGVSELAKIIGKSEEYVSHRILLLNLPREILSRVTDKSISPSKARELVWMNDSELQKELSGHIVKQKLSVKEIREAAKLVRKGIKVEDAVNTVSDEKFAWDRQYKEEKPDQDSILMERSEAVLRIAMMRVDELIEQVRSEPVREFLIQERFEIHQLIDRCIKRRKEIASPNKMYLSPIER